MCLRYDNRLARQGLCWTPPPSIPGACGAFRRSSSWLWSGDSSEVPPTCCSLRLSTLSLAASEEAGAPQAADLPQVG